MFGIQPKRVSAVEIITELGEKPKEADLHKCCHGGGNNCVGYWKLKPGSGIQRGYCSRCNDYFCSPGCQTCVPYEKWLEEESKLAEIYNKIALGR